MINDSGHLTLQSSLTRPQTLITTVGCTTVGCTTVGCDTAGGAHRDGPEQTEARHRDQQLLHRDS
jgi:hypothetical protein